MNYMKQPMTNYEDNMKEEETPKETEQEGGMDETSDMTPMDEAISMVDSYIKNPKLATPETLANLKSMLEDMKPMIDGDDREGMDEPMDSEDDSEEPKGHGLTIVIGQMKKKGEGK